MDEHRILDRPICEHRAEGATGLPLVVYRVGSRNEIPGQTGLAHMLEHMLFKGTKKLGPEDYSKIVARNGGNENAFTSEDQTVYFATLAADRLSVALEMAHHPLTA